jgi:hypothetical protein
MSQEKQRAIAYCPHCGNDSPQEFITSYTRFKPEMLFYELVHCLTCWTPLLYSFDGNSPPTRCFSLKERVLLWPQAKSLPDSVPRRIRRIYEEAVLVKQRAPNAFANQIRRCLEALCNDKEATGNNLSSQLRDLADKDEIPPVLAEMTDVLRLFGNMGSHDDDVSVGKEYVQVIDEFFWAVVEYVYIAPQRINEIRKQLEAARQADSGSAV